MRIFYVIALATLFVAFTWLAGAAEGRTNDAPLFTGGRFYAGLMLACVTLLAMVIVWVIRPLWRSLAAEPIVLAETANGGVETEFEPAPVNLRAAVRMLGDAARNSETEDRATSAYSVDTFKAAVDFSAIPIMITDADARIEYVNDAFLRQSGYQRNELVGKNAGVVKSGRTRREVYEDLWRTLRSGRSWRGELVNRRRSGGEYWEQIAIAPLRDANGCVTHFVAVREDITERKRREDALRQMAHLDSLTGIGNRRALMERADNELRRAERFGLALSLLILDIDRFKQINDRYGHSCGDEAIRMVARCCVEHVREIDFVGRFGGEEFVAVMPGTVLAGAREVAERLRIAVSRLQLDCGENGTLNLTASIGIAQFRSGEPLEHLFAAADAALYRAKSLGRDRVVAVTDDVDEVEAPPAQ